MNTPIALDQIRQAAKRLAEAHNVTTARGALLNEECRVAIAPILAEHRAAMDAAAEAEARAHAELVGLLTQAPALFVRPRSLTVDGVRAGYKAEPDTLGWADDDTLIAAIKEHLPDLAATLIRTQESLVKDALANIDPAHHKALGLHVIPGADRPFVTIGDSDVEKVAKGLIADAMRRQGDDDEPRARKGKAPAKAKPTKETA